MYGRRDFVQLIVDFLVSHFRSDDEIRLQGGDAFKVRLRLVAKVFDPNQARAQVFVKRLLQVRFDRAYRLHAQENARIDHTVEQNDDALRNAV